jgi:hypothetical protein
MEIPLEREQECQMVRLLKVPKRWMFHAMQMLPLPTLLEQAQQFQAHQQEQEKPLPGFLCQAVLLADRAERRAPVLRVRAVDPVHRQQPDRPSPCGGRPLVGGSRYACHVPIHNRA